MLQLAFLFSPTDGGGGAHHKSDSPALEMTELWAGAGTQGPHTAQILAMMATLHPMHMSAVYIMHFGQSCPQAN